MAFALSSDLPSPSNFAVRAANLPPEPRGALELALAIETSFPSPYTLQKGQELLDFPGNIPLPNNPGDIPPEEPWDGGLII